MDEVPAEIRPTASGAEWACLRGGGEMGALMRAKDWSASPLGPVERWSPALRTMTSILLANRFPMLLWWGPDQISIYNDAYIPVLATKHPRALGEPVREVWSEIWHILRPLILTPFNGGPPTWSDDLELAIRRRGFLEETHFTVAYSPVPDETAPNGIGGVLATVNEITRQVVAERRGVVLRELGVRLAEAKTAEDACHTAAHVFAEHPKDVPFALMYLVEENGRAARLAGATGIEQGGPASPLTLALEGNAGGDPWELASAVRSKTVQLIGNLRSRLPAAPSGPWPDPPDRALVLPVLSRPATDVAAVLVAGVSALLELDASYRGFLDLAAAQLGTAIANARAYDEERRRGQALAELDRAKTVFFGNVSHEFRTPLTLMLGHVEDGLEDGDDALSASQRERQLSVHRNALRLLKLVNSLLDFSRIEAGRIKASYEPVDVAVLTTEIASTFRSIAERAGLKLVLDCSPLPEPVFVDREMWEKIVLNLVSNAFKFTFDGEIRVLIGSEPGSFHLAVQDTGTGIEEEHLPHLFERFYRVEGARGRTYEGSGIGLALVRELARLHGGSASVRSQRGQGTTFTVTLPTGSAHLPKDRIQAPRALASTAVGAQVFVEEAASWLGSDTSMPPSPEASSGSPREELEAPAHLLVADDNADMRAYLQRLLRPIGSVELVRDGQQALEAVQRRQPDIVLSDVMMPNLDGFGLLRALREDERTKTIPIVLLSARAGEESRVEGASAGADDYIVKPFSARELVARIRAQLQLARQRREHAEALRNANLHLAEANQRKTEFLAMLSHELRNPLAPIKNSLYILDRAAPGGEQAARARGVIGRQVDHLTRLVDDLLDVTRISRGKIQLLQELVDVADVARRAAEDHRAAFARGGVELELEVPDRAVWVNGDRVRLSQVIGNLLQNSAKFTDLGGKAVLSLQADRGGRRVVLRVRDSGIGIEPRMLPYVFEPFTQAATTLDRSKGGLGLGLAVVKGLVEMHGGSVTAASEGTGRGTELTIVLPWDPDLAPHERAEAGAHRLGAKQRILVIEDNLDAAETLRDLLELYQHEVEVAFSGLEGIEKARSFKPHVVLCDIGLPGMDGFAVARAFRSDPELRKATMVALSGYVSPEDLAHSKEAGFDGHVAKPPSMEKLAEALREPRRGTRAEKPGVGADESA